MQVFSARRATRARFPQTSTISGINGSPSDIPFSSSVAAISDAVFTRTQSPVRNLMSVRRRILWGLPQLPMNCPGAEVWLS